MTPLEILLKKYQQNFACVLPGDLQHGDALIFNLSPENNDFEDINYQDTAALIEHSQKLLEAHNAVIAIGRYGEQRDIYQRSPLFSDPTQNRDVHIGIDLSVPPTTPIYAPWAATVHSFKNNEAYGDYGPTIILKHRLEDLDFYTLYGHLSKKSLEALTPHKSIEKGMQFAEVGDPYENGCWPSHLHFQIIAEIGGYHGDFPGVVTAAEKEDFMKRCPNPNFILNIKALEKMSNCAQCFT